MRRILLLYILLSVVGLTTVHAQFNPGRQQIDENGYDQYGNQVDPAMIPDRLDSANVEVKGLPPTLYMWRIKNQLGDRTIIPADTAYHHFQNTNLTEGITGHYNYLANMGSPRMSRIFFDRRYPEPTIFMEPFPVSLSVSTLIIYTDGDTTTIRILHTLTLQFSAAISETDIRCKEYTVTTI